MRRTLRPAMITLSTLLHVSFAMRDKRNVLTGIENSCSISLRQLHSVHTETPKRDLPKAASDHRQCLRGSAQPGKP